MSGGQALELPGLPDACWPVDPSCIEGWDDVYDPEDPDAGGYSDADKAAAVALAGQTMRMLTGYRVGGCPVTVRPCTQACHESTWRGRGGVGWAPVQQGGRWLNIGCGHAGGCGCTHAHEVRLPPPAGQVTEVVLDGVTLDPSAYRLDTGGRLVRTDGVGWPLSNDLTVTEGPGAWHVSYVPGYPVDGLGAQAAGRLAAEYVKACSTGECDLPQAVVTGLSRNGVTMTLTPGAFPEGKTGIRTVDAYLERWNPYALSVPPMVWSPDLDQHRVVGSAGVSPGLVDGGNAPGAGGYFNGGDAPS